MSRILCLLLVATIPALAFAQRKTREEKVREDRQRVEADGFWMYNDLPGAFEKARETGKPLLVVLRCIPCEECVKLDDDLVDKDPVIRPLLDKFICVRQVSMNGLDLSLFQFDTDQSFAVFMLNADNTVYGRFGTRSHRAEWLQDVSIAGLAKALQGALKLHANYPANKDTLAGKHGKPMEVASPEQFPSLRDKYTDSLNVKGDVVKSCIHCHQIGDAQRTWYRASGKPIPEHVLYSYPHPRTIGLVMDPEEMATIEDIEPTSAADRSGLRPGDRIEMFDGQAILSTADIQWVLHNIDASGGPVSLSVMRNGVRVDTLLRLNADWRRAGDISWRVSSWGLRRMATGGLLLKTLPDEERSKLGIGDGTMSLRVWRVGQYGPHAAAKKAGFQRGDVIVTFDGHTDLMTDTAVLTYGVTERRPGDRVDVVVLRDGKRKTLRMPMQE